MPTVTVTERAAKEFLRVCEEMGVEEGTMLRVGVAGGGCSGFQYDLRPDTAVDDKMDDVTDQHGVKVVVDRKSALYLEGTTIDFYEGLDRRGFTFDNPNATKSCGCGTSFQA